jgi:hypothetical protein
MRKQFCAYTKGIGGGPGLAGGARLRNLLVHAETIIEYHTIIQNEFSKNPVSFGKAPDIQKSGETGVGTNGGGW